MTSRERKILLWFAAGLIVCLLLASPFLYDSLRMRSIRLQARTLKVGDSQAEVAKTLGRPDDVGGPRILDPTKYWLYRRRFDRLSMHEGLPPIWPFRSQLRIIRAPGPGDVMIKFDDDGEVLAISVP